MLTVTLISDKTTFEEVMSSVYALKMIIKAIVYHRDILSEFFESKVFTCLKPSDFIMSLFMFFL